MVALQIGVCHLAATNSFGASALRPPRESEAQLIQTLHASRVFTIPPQSSASPFSPSRVGVLVFPSSSFFFPFSPAPLPVFTFPLLRLQSSFKAPGGRRVQNKPKLPGQGPGRTLHGLLLHAPVELIFYVPKKGRNLLLLSTPANPGWMSQTRHKRRLFLEQFDRLLVTPL
ncbi:hypothetical protein CRENBAI_007359, partial [Crenichthys baileyi]